MKTPFKTISLGLAFTVLAGAPAAMAAPAAAPPLAPTPAPALTPAPAPALAPTQTALTGPLVPGVCLFSQEDLIERSLAGQAAVGRLRVLTQDVQTALDAEKARLERKGNALAAQRASLPPAQFQTQATALNQRAQALQTQAAERSHQVDATRAKALNHILQEAQPFIAQAFTAHGCGLLVSRGVVLGGNLGNDLTPEVISTLDAKVAPQTFDLEPASAAAK